MGRKKKKPLKPWCWYCNREFDDDKILTQHQRAKHYKCPFCHKKLYSGPGLTVHCVQVHKEKLDKIPEALPNRNSVDIDIYGMQGIPEEDLREHERLKRGDDGRSKTEQDSKVQANKSHNTNHHQPQHPPPLGLPSNPMHAAMFQHAMSMGMMPPGFSMPPGAPPMSLPPGFMPPPGFPGMPPPSMHPTIPPPPLHPGMPVPQMHPGMPPPPLGFPHMMPPTSSAQFHPPSLAFHGPPPPPPPPPDEPTTSSGQQLPPPMSGAGSLLGVPPPNFKQTALPPPIKPQGDSQQGDHDTKSSAGSQSSSHLSQASQQSTDRSSPLAGSQNANASTAVTASTIAKPAVITNSESTSLVVKDYIDIPSAKARIMHPNEDLSLEEMRLRLTKYKQTKRTVVAKEAVG